MARVQSNKTSASKPLVESAVAAKAASAKNRPAIKSKIVSSEELPVAPEKGVVFENGVRKDIGSDIEIEGNVYGLSDKAAELAFMEEFVTVNIAEDTGSNPERYVYLSVNGIGAGPGGIEWVPRGVDVTIKRKYLNLLAGARQVRYKNFEYTNNDGERMSAQRASSADRYPFQVVEDQNPRGREWLKQLRATRRAG